MNMLNTAIKHLSRKSCSERELRDFLENQFGELVNLEKRINDVMSYLISHRLIHDMRLAEQLTLHYAHKGNQFIQRLLKQRKINEQLINQSLMSIPDELTRAWEETQKRLGSLFHLDQSEKSSTLIRFLMGRQFSLAVVNQVIDKINNVKPYQLKNSTSYQANYY
ncbi:MAG: regulatory protein RecX [bacterium]|nr:regulatory protein RecX [bacterium]